MGRKPTGRKNTGGKSYRIDCVVSPELYDAVQDKMAEKGITKISEAARLALAAWVKQPKLGKGMGPGRPTSEE